MKKDGLSKNNFKRKLTALTICLSMVFSIVVNNGNVVVRAESGQSGAIHLGDVDLDGTVTLQDAQLALRASLLLTELSDMQLQNADLHQKGRVVLEDARMILRHALLLETIEDALSGNQGATVTTQEAVKPTEPSREAVEPIEPSREAVKPIEPSQGAVEPTKEAVKPTEPSQGSVEPTKEAVKPEETIKDVDYVVSHELDFGIRTDKESYKIGEHIQINVQVTNDSVIPIEMYGATSSFGKTSGIMCKLETKDGEFMVSDWSHLLIDESTYRGALEVGESITAEREIIIPEDLPSGEYILSLNFRYMRNKEKYAIYSKTMTLVVEESPRDVERMVKESLDFYWQTDRYSYATGESIKVNMEITNYNSIPINVYGMTSSFGKGSCIDYVLETKDGEYVVSDWSHIETNCEEYRGTLGARKGRITESLITEREISIPEALPSGEYVLRANFRYLKYDGSKGIYSKEKYIRIMDPTEIEYIVRKNLDINIQTDKESYATGESVQIDIQVTNNSDIAIDLYGYTTSYGKGSCIEYALQGQDGNYITGAKNHVSENSENYWGILEVKETIITQRSIIIPKDLASGKYMLEITFVYLKEDDKTGSHIKEIPIIIE